ncbi:hypothetical protein GCM10011374_29670 [Kocuria dechangensis]|uniref:SLH domain-containing protein n=1 Tax=Kocuria dechangensis TaxID=1176249 RepID=A0A917LXH3_9MICC|nr:S-layer homology domain-containing protein [Kocuria dechangensis]GGG64172.1 hypothetical protein GCM10011374_29670 [Kocuria dechangensis]
MSDRRRTSASEPSAGVSRRHLLGATAVLGSAVAVTAGPAEPASAAVVLGSAVPMGNLGLTSAVAGRHRDVFRSFALTNSSGIGVIQVGTVRYLATFNAGDGADTVQVFNADTGALHFRASTPGKADGNFAHDGRGTLYFSSGAALMAVSVPNRTIRRIGTAPSGVTNLYEFQIDHQGRLWAGTFPAGIVLCLDPSTGREIARTPVLGSGNQYARGLSISPDRRTIWAGSGTGAPALYRIDVDRPSAPQRIPIPGVGGNSIVSRTVAFGRRVFVWHENSSGKEVVSEYDLVTKSWAASTVVMTARSMTQPDSQGYVYVNGYGVLRRFRPEDPQIVVETVGTLPQRYTVHIALAGGKLYLLTEGASVLAADRMTTAAAQERHVDYAVVPVPLATQSMTIDRARSTVYAGGFKGDGLCSTQLTTGAFAHSAPTAGIEQIERMMVDGDRLYIGSYPSGVIVDHLLPRGVKDPGSYRQLATLGTSHLQSRIYAWASATSHVVFGTVPETGRRGGVLGVVNRSTGAVHVYGELLPELSIVGLTATGNTVYGTTSVRGGLGAAEYAGDAQVFAFDTSTGKLLWRRTLPGTKELYQPILMGSKLYVATLDTVVELRLSDGAPLRTFVLGSRTGQPGWQNVAMIQIPGTTRLAHLAWGTLTVLSTATGLYDRVLTDAHRHLDLDGAGNLWATVRNDVVKLRMEPTGQGDTAYMPPSVSPFRDVSTTQQFYKEMAWLAARKISTGWDDGTYRPLRPINRDAMAAFLYRMAGSPAYTPPRVSPFRDVSTTQQFYKEMAWLAARGISTGWTEADGSRTYRPLQPINRDAMAAFLYRMVASTL